jgi:hypothetical protein
MAPVMESRVFEHVGEDFIGELCQRHRFEPVDRPAERHGSWEWAFRKRAGGLRLTRAVSRLSLPTRSGSPAALSEAE